MASGDTPTDRQSRRAWVAWSPITAQYSGYLAEVDEAGEEIGVVDELEAAVTLDEALAWARAAAGRVYVRPEWDDSVTYWAGDGTSTTHPHLDETRTATTRRSDDPERAFDA